MSNTIVLGSGMAAWGASDRLKSEGITPRLFDKNSFAGGHTATFENKGFYFDDGPHISFTSIERMQQVFSQAVDADFEVLRADVDNWYEGQWVIHPAIANLFGLPTELVAQIIEDFVAVSATPAPESFANYNEWLLAAFGKTFADKFPAAYGRKYHTVDPTLMNTSWLGPRLYRPDVGELIRGALAPAVTKQHYVDTFRYPKRNGFVEYLAKFHAASDLSLGHEAVGIDPGTSTITFGNGVVEQYERLISSIPLPELIKMLPAPPEVAEAAEKLSCSQCVVVNFGVARDDLSPCHWRYVYDEDIRTVRMSFPHMFSTSTVPPGHGAVQVEVYYSDKYKPLDHKPEDEIEPVRQELIRMGILREDDTYLVEEARYIPYANVIFDLDSGPCTELVHSYLTDIGIDYCGRYGDWAYIWTDESYLSGELAVERMLERG
ncbi:MAG: protoporphyrinogen/coproporphyrinogen oxidase [Acidimicrobiales bacterium]